MAAIQTSVRYESDGTTALWPIPFPFAGAADIGVKVTGADGRERVLTAGADYVLSGACVMAVVPAGQSVVIWLKAAVAEALAAARQQAVTAAGPTYGGMGAAAVQEFVPQAVTTVMQDVVAPSATGTKEAGLAAELGDLRAQLASLREEREAALMAARAAQADAQVQRLAEEGSAGVARLAEEAAARIAELETTAAQLRSALREQAATMAEERAALAEARGRLEAVLAPAQTSLAALDAGMNAARQETQQLATLTTDARLSVEEAAEAAEASRKGAETARLGAETARRGAETAQRTAEAASRAAEESAQDAAGDRARAEQAASASASSEAEAAGWADAAAESAEQAFGSAECSWRAAWHASLAAQPDRPGLAAVASVPELLGALSGAYILNPHIRHGPTVFMGLWPLEDMAHGGGWDGVFFLGPPYPDVPVPPPASPCPPPVRPDGPGSDTTTGAPGVWGPCSGQGVSV